MPTIMRKFLIAIAYSSIATFSIGNCNDIFVGFDPDLAAGTLVEWVLPEADVKLIDKITSADGLNKLKIGDFINASFQKLADNPFAGVYDGVTKTMEGNNLPSVKDLAFESIEIREIDLGRTKDNPFGSKKDRSGIYAINIRLRSTKSYATCRIVFLHTGEIVIPVRRNLTELERQILKSIENEVNSDHAQ